MCFTMVRIRCDITSIAPNNGPRSGYESLFCLGDALKSNGLSLALDAVGLIPEGGVFAGAFSLWHGAAGVSNGINNLRAVKMGAGIIGTASSSQDSGWTGTAGSGLGTASIAVGLGAAQLGKAAPVLGTVLSLGSLAVDLTKTFSEQSDCVDNGKYN